MIEKKELERIFRQYYGAMYRLSLRMLGDEAESKDVVSDVFAQLLNNTVELKAEKLHNYLLTATRNRCINLLVQRQRNRGVFVDMYEENNDRQELLHALYHYIEERFSPLSQQILLLRYQQGMKYREIAEALHVSEVTVHNHLSQSLKQMKEYFKTKDYGL